MSVYKACKKSIVTMELLPDSKTNEHRSGVVNADFTKFRTDKVKVLSIFNITTNEEMDEDISNYISNFVYKVGTIIETGFDDIYVVCGRGIHYYKTYEAALSWYYENNPNDIEKHKFSGKLEGWDENGLKNYKYNYKNGLLDGKQEFGRHELNYKNGEKDGKQEMWYSDGSKGYIHNYKDGKYEGKQETWHYNGQKQYEHNYKDGKMDGKQEYWFPSGNKCYEDYYKDGKKQSN